MKAIGRTMNNVAIKSASKYRIRNTIKLNLSNNHDLFKITCLCFHIWSSYNSLQHFSFLLISTLVEVTGWTPLFEHQI
jgi:hypothetical protein